jgi:hypothetical protein
MPHAARSNRVTLILLAVLLTGPLAAGAGAGQERSEPASRTRRDR